MSSSSSSKPSSEFTDSSTNELELSSSSCSEFSEVDGKNEGKADGTPDFTAIFNVVMTAVGVGMLALSKATASVGCRVMALHLGMEYVPAYEELGEAAFGKVGKTIVAICLHISLIGTSCVLILLLGQNSYHIYDGISVTWWVIIWTVILLPVNWLKTMREIGYVSSTIGVASIIVSVIGLSVAGFVQAADNNGDVDYEIGVPQPITIIGAYTTFSFSYSVTCGTTTVVHDMRNPTHAPKVFFFAFATLVVVYAVVTCAAYLGWGQGLCYDNVLDAMRKDVWGYISFVSIVVLCATHYAVLLHPSCRAIEVLAGLEDGSPRAEKWGKWPTLVATCCLRSLLVVITAVIAITVPNFSLLVDYLSAVTYTLVHLIFPPLFYMRLRYLMSRSYENKELAKAEGNFGSKRATMRSLSLIFLMLVALLGSALTLYKTVDPPATPEECSLLSL
ncbi:hypothetical protein FOZ63_027292 [Perkinsus olseni]|uniref:Amino acid transporter transmembrane domain-containing protein n=1 Tax=Perkinsus olseni TaxID=32597 RepID=A0A7J6RBR3_PEROL|nr:hypothetical protein FOZ63_027292 [Perkinsus olseni]